MNTKRLMMLAVLWCLVVGSYAQNSMPCTNPQFITVANSCTPTFATYNLGESSKSFEFTATANTVQIEFSTLNLNSPANIGKAYLYVQPQCSFVLDSTDLIGDTLGLRTNNLNIGSNYVIEVVRYPQQGLIGEDYPEASFNLCATKVGETHVEQEENNCSSCGTNLVANGDFEQGFTAFFSTLVPTTPGNSWSSSNKFAVTNQAGVNLISNVWDCTNHTFGGDLFGVFDISQTNNSSHFLWKQTVPNLTAGETYYFSCWLNNLIPPSQASDYFVLPVIGLYVNGIEVAAITVGTTPDEWIPLCGSYTLPENGALTAAVLQIRAKTIGSHSNGGDLGIDDIRFTNNQLSPPTILASNTTLCAGQCIQFESSINYAESYQWEITLNGDFVDGGITSAPTYEFCPTEGGVYEIKLSVQCGGDLGVNSASEVYVFEVAPFPFALGPIIGSNSMCCSDQGYSIQGLPQNYTYQWDISNGSPFTGQGTSQIVADWTNAPSGNAQVSVTVTSPDGCTSTVTMDVEDCCTQPANLTLPIFYSTNPCEIAFASDLISNQNGGSNVVNQAGKAIIINGEFIVDVPQLFFLAAQDFYLGPDARITIASGNELVISTSTLQASCNAMWDGIYITDNTAKLTVNNSTIRDAKNAAVAQLGGQIDIQNTLMQDNWKAVVLEQNTSAANLLFTGNTVSSSFNLLSPYNTNNERGNKGVDIIQNSNIAITGSNTFINLDYGIYAVNTNLTVRNNTFLSMPQVQNSSDPTSGTAIYSIGTGQSSYILRVGGAINLANTFTSCYRGVYAKNRINPDVQFNTFNTVQYTGVYCTQNSNGLFRVKDNTFNNLKNIGIHAFGNVNTGVDIQANQLLYAHVTNSNTLKAAIVVNDALLSNANSTISNNYIENAERGIFVNNRNGALIQENQVRWTLSNSQVAAYGQTLKGMLITMCPNSQVMTNNILRFGDNPNGQNTTNLMGIHIENSNNIEVIKNTTRRMGSGIYLKGSNSASTLSCNTAWLDWQGFLFENADIGDQGSATMPSDNKWVQNQGSFKMEGLLNSPSDWNHRNGNTYNPNPYSGLLAGSNLFVINGASGQSQCSGIIIVDQGQGREKRFGKIVRGEKVFAQNEIEHVFYDNVVTYMALRNNLTLLNLGLSNDIDYQSFYQQIDASNIGKLVRVGEYLESGQAGLAASELATINPTNSCESNCKAVCEIYLATFGVGNFQFTSQQQLDLETIACQDALFGGSGVYTARGMLGWDNLPCANIRTALVSSPIIESNSLIIGKAYPNPNTGQFSIDYQLKETDKGQIEIFDLSGKLIQSELMSGTTNKVDFSLFEIQDGIYFYRISINGEVVTTDKVVVIR